MRNKYLPMLRSKAGEATALSNLTTAAKDRMMPVIHLVHAPPITFAARIGAAWADRPMALDGTFQTDTIGTTQNYIHMFDQIGRARVRLIPSIEHNATLPYLTAVQRMRNRYAQGVLVKSKLNQLQNVLGWVRAQGWSPSEIDLVVALGEIANFDSGTLIPAVGTTITNHIPNPSPWRSLTLSASAAPQDHGGLATGRNNVPRLDWRVWHGISPNLPCQIDYADYSTTTPELTDPPGYVMARATVSARYTVDDDWIILKGRPTTGRNAQQMGPQYRRHAQTLFADPNFGGLIGCWADGHIQQVAAGIHSPGGRREWAAYAASRHLSFIANRLP